MTGKQRVMAVLRGEVPDRVPFAPNIGQWFDYHKHNGTVPDELQDCRDELDAMLKLQCDIFSRRVGSFFKIKQEGYEVRSYKEPIGNAECGVLSLSKGGMRDVEYGSSNQSRPPHEQIHPPIAWTVTEYITPFGTLRGKSRFEPESHTSYEHEHFVKDFERDYKALRYIVENTHHTFDEEAYRRVEERVGDNGVIIVPMSQSPIKLLHIWAGQENATLFMLDYEKECQELFELHTQKVLEMAKQGANSPALCFILGDNLDSLFHSPPLFRKFALRFYQQVADVLHSAGKLLFSHACGRLWALRELIAEANLDGLEGIPHPPLGDLPLPEAKKIHPRFIVNGGMTCHELEVFEDARTNIHAYVKSLFEAMHPFDRFIFSSG